MSVGRIRRSRLMRCREDGVVAWARAVVEAMRIWFIFDQIVFSVVSCACSVLYPVSVECLISMQRL